MKKKLMFLLACPLLLTACSSDEPARTSSIIEDEWLTTDRLELTAQEIKDINNFEDFNYKLINSVSKGYEDMDFVVSPGSVSMFLSVLANASDGETPERILQVLGFDNMDRLNSLNSKLMHFLPCEDNFTTFDINNRFWVSHQYQAEQKAIDVLKTNYNAYIENVDFKDKKTIPAINGWISDKTNGLINEFFEGGWRGYEESVMLMANTLYFRGEWSSKFDRNQTDTCAFYSPRGESDVEMMHKVLWTRYSENDFVQMVTLGFNGARVDAEFFLPKEGVSVNDMIERLTPDALKDLRRNGELALVTLSLPKFQTETKGMLRGQLEDMGLNLEEVDFSPLGISSLLPADIGQHCILKIDEDGAELAAVTGLLFGSTGETPKREVTLTYNRPFFYQITTSNLLMVAGTVVNPQ